MIQDPLSRQSSMPLVKVRDYLLRHASTRSLYSRLLRRISFPLLLSIVLFGQMLGNGMTAQAAVHPPVKLPIAQANFTLQQFLKQSTSSQISKRSSPLPGSSQPLPVLNTVKSKTPPQTSLPSAEPAKMKAALQTLSSSFLKNQPTSTTGTTSNASLDVVGSDTQGQRMEVVIPAGALDLSKATTDKGTTPQGTLTLKLSQVRGHFSAATTDLGSFQIQVIDGQGAILQGVSLHTPITLIYHYRSKELSTLGLDPGRLYLIWSDRLTAATTAKQSIAGDVIPMQNNAKTSTLTAHSSVLSVTPFVLGAGTDPIQAPPKPIFASVQGNGGQLSYSYPLQVAPGPAGTAPTLQAIYSSATTNARNAPTTPADNVGEGWALTLGSITASKYPDGTIWYALDSVDNVSDRLIPDTSGTNFATEHLSYLKVKLNTSLNCFQVWDTAGNYYEYGCTTDSLQYYLDSSGNRTNYRYDLDKMIPANEGSGTNGRNLTASYVQDHETSGGHTWVRDAALQQITYGNGTSRIGTIDFFYNGPTNYSSGGIQYVTQYTSGYETACNLPVSSPQPQRCDDPIDRSGGLVDPDVMSTLSLQTVKTYVGDDSSTTHLDYSYSFAYQESAFGNCPSADTTLSSAYCAGNHLLTSITPTVYQNGTGHQMPAVTFGYSGGRTNKYDDSSQSYHMENSWNYLTSYHDHRNGVGASSIVYHTAYNNSHGTPYIAGDNRYDALFCINNVGSCNSGTSFYPMDDKMWTEQVVTQITAAGKDSSASSLAPATTTYNYWLTKTQGSCPADTASPPDSDCVGFGWIPNSGTDWQSFYHGEFRGFGTVLVTSPAGDLTVDQYASTWGWDSPSSDPRNYLAGQLLEEDVYQGGTVTDANLLTKTVSSYGGLNSTSAACASTSTYPSTTYRPCEVVVLNTHMTRYEKTGSSNTNAPWVQNDDTYDDYTTSSGLGDHHQSPATGSYHNLQQEVISSSNAPTVTKHWTYNTTDSTSGSWTYYNVHTVAHSDVVDASGHMWQCADTLYDEGVAAGVPKPDAGWATTDTTYSNCANQSGTAIKTYTGYDTWGDTVATVDGVAAATPSLYSSAGCTLSTAPAFFPTSSWSAVHYTTCDGYDSISSLPTNSWNALGHHTTTSYAGSQGLLPATSTDANGQTTTTSYSYDSSGNPIVQVSAPGEAGSYTSQSTLKSTCTDSSSLPCMEVDSNSLLYNSAITQIFYDSLGRRVETLTAGSDSSHSIVTFITYNDQTHAVFTSQPFVVASRNTWLDPNGVTNIKGTATTLDPLGRTLSVTDALSHVSSTIYGLGTSGVSGDSNTYAMTTDIDTNNHVAIDYSDALGRTIYAVDDSGLNGGTLTANRRKTFQYDVLDDPTSVVVTDLVPQVGQTITSVTTTAQYDDLGRITSLNDPDRGNHTYSYDANGQMITDVSGTRTLGYSYDLLGRLGCLQDRTPTSDVHGACSSGANPFVVNSYDADPGGVSWGSTTYPIGQLTQSVATTYYPAPDNAQGTVTDNTQYDQRGQPITQRMQIAVTGSASISFPTFPQYQEAIAYNDANQQTTTQTTVGGQPGFTFTQAYDGTTGAQIGLSNTTTGTATLAGLGYNTQGLLSDIQFKDTSGAQLADQQLSYDGNLRPASSTTTWQNGGGTIASDGVSYDNVGNVISRASTLAAVPGINGSGGNEVQNFCYDEQNRLVWASNTVAATPTGGQSCGNTSLQGQGTLGGSYTSNYVYTHLGQLWQGPLNGTSTQEQYLYCNSGQPHQVTALSPASGNPTCAAPGTADYKSSYDNWGNVTSRTYPATTVGSPVYDAQDTMVRWSGTTPTSSQGEWYLYDASGNRVLRRSASTTTGGNPATSAATITTYAFGVEEHVYQYSGSGSSATTTGNTYYYSLAGHLIGTLSGTSTLSTNFLLTDLLGSVVATISNTVGSATVLGNQVYGPYGNKRYTAGSVGTSKGFTGQYADDLTGLDYYVSRYYDPVVSGFLSADTVEGNPSGMDPYAYVEANPETKSDPTGHWGWAFPAVASFFTAAAEFVAADVVAAITWPFVLVVALIVVAIVVVAFVVHQVQTKAPSTNYTRSVQPTPEPAPTPTPKRKIVPPVAPQKGHVSSKPNPTPKPQPATGGAGAGKLGKDCTPLDVLNNFNLDIGHSLDHLVFNEAAKDSHLSNGQSYSAFRDGMSLDQIKNLVRTAIRSGIGRSSGLNKIIDYATNTSWGTIYSPDGRGVAGNLIRVVIGRGCSILTVYLLNRGR